MTTNSKLRFMDNQKIVGNYSVTNEDSNFPLSNALGSIRSKVFRTTGTETRITIDLLFSDYCRAFTLFAPLGEKLGISKEATIKLQADNVADWVSPEYDETLSLSSDDSLVFFTDLNYRFVSLYIDDPTNHDGFISFADIFLGDYTTTTIRNINRGFNWVTVDPSISSRSLNGTLYYDTKTQYDTLGGIQYGMVTEEDRQTLERIYNKKGTTNFMPISIDPDGCIGPNTIEDLTKLARINGNFSRTHRVFEYYDISIALEEVI
jgi:hypothetical protein